MNPTERIVYDLCRNSFLSLWSYPNPLKRDGKELCDVLVVCEPDIIIFSVKDIGLATDGDESVNIERWQRRAIDSSIKQIYGAEREIISSTNVIRSDRTQGLQYPSSANRRIHRVAVAFGDKGRAFIPSGDFERGFVHVLDEISLKILLKELDTITDFENFLSYVENLPQYCKKVIVEGGSEELLGFYMRNERRNPDKCDLLSITHGFWDDLIKRPEFIARKEEDRISYFWDSMIEELCEHLDFSIEGPPPSLSDSESVIRTLARENRFNRRLLSESFHDWHVGGISRSRCIQSLSGVVYVFLTCSRNTDRKDRRNELGCRCFVARGMCPDSTTVVGIGTEVYDPSGYSYDLVHLHKPVWTEEDSRMMQTIQKQGKVFKNAKWERTSRQEYPNPGESKES